MTYLPPIILIAVALAYISMTADGLGSIYIATAEYEMVSGAILVLSKADIITYISMVALALGYFGRPHFVSIVLTIATACGLAVGIISIQAMSSAAFLPLPTAAAFIALFHIKKIMPTE